MATHPISTDTDNLPGPAAEQTPERPVATSETKTKKKLIRRTDANNSQKLRRIFQFAFVALNLYLGLVFYMWTLYYETGGTRGWNVERPAGVEGWLPIAALMNLKYAILTQAIPKIHPAAMFLLVAFLTMSVLLKKSFCSWLCPVGTLSEYLWKFGRKIFRTNIKVHRYADIPLRGLKYLLLGFFVYIIGQMSAIALAQFLETPYGIIADVKMLNFFRDMSDTALLVVTVLVALSIFIQNVWCRYLCPYGALLGIISMLSPTKIRRDADACIDCAKCAKACPSSLPVDKLVKIQSAECTACMECVAVCPAEDALQFALPPRRVGEPGTPPGSPAIAARWYNRTLQPWAVAAAIALVFFGIVGYAKVAGHWQTNIPSSVYMELVPRAGESGHPGM